jgi:hypothetical protein
MIEIALIIAAMALMAGKKKATAPIFGQLTLTNDLALEYLKSSLDGFTRRATKILWITPLEAQAKGYSIPDWVIQNYEKFEWSAIVYDESNDVLPLFVYQNSALQELEKKLAEFEAEGAEIVQDSPRSMTINFGDNPAVMRFWRNEKGGKFARYHLEVKDE